MPGKTSLITLALLFMPIYCLTEYFTQAWFSFSTIFRAVFILLAVLLLMNLVFQMLPVCKDTKKKVREFIPLAKQLSVKEYDEVCERKTQKELQYL